MNEHSKIEIIATEHFPNMQVEQSVIFKVSGCEICVRAAIIYLFVNSPSFREMMNACGRIADEIRAIDNAGNKAAND